MYRFASSASVRARAASRRGRAPSRCSTLDDVRVYDREPRDIAIGERRAPAHARAPRERRRHERSHRAGDEHDAGGASA